MNLKQKIIIISGLINMNMYALYAKDKEQYITISELKEILKDYVRKDGKTLNINKKRFKLYNKTLKGANTKMILNKIKYLYKTQKYEDIKYRCEYIKDNLVLKEYQKENYYYFYAVSLFKTNDYQAAIKYYKLLLELEDKKKSNMEVLQYMLEVYKKTDDFEKIKELEDILN
jgi:tetratricopeptide (TPR) repeat protein